MRNNVVTHLFDDDDNQLCNCDGPAVSAASLLQSAGDLTEYCPICARAVLAPIVKLIHTRCGMESLSREPQTSAAHHLLQAILSLATTPPDEEAAVMRIMADALAVLGDYIDDAEADHA